MSFRCDHVQWEVRVQLVFREQIDCSEAFGRLGQCMANHSMKWNLGLAVQQLLTMGDNKLNCVNPSALYLVVIT